VVDGRGDIDIDNEPGSGQGPGQGDHMVEYPSTRR
jgi:hypothetical protein